MVFNIVGQGDWLFSHLVLSDTLWSHRLQYASLPCSSLSPGVCSKFMSIESMMPSNHLILCRPLLLLPSVFPSIRVFPMSRFFPPGGQTKYWILSFSISPSNEYSGLISFRIDWFDLLAIQDTLKSLLQCHNLKASILLCSVRQGRGSNSNAL